MFYCTYQGVRGDRFEFPNCNAFLSMKIAFILKLCATPPPPPPKKKKKKKLAHSVVCYLGIYYLPIIYWFTIQRVLWVGLQCVIVAFPGGTHFLK